MPQGENCLSQCCSRNGQEVQRVIVFSVMEVIFMIKIRHKAYLNSVKTVVPLATRLYRIFSLDICNSSECCDTKSSLR